MKNSKFNSLFQESYNRFTNGGGFLAGDVVKLKAGFENNESFKNLAANVQQRLKEMASSKNNIRVSKLHNFVSPARYSAEGAGTAPAELADCFEEAAPGYWHNLITIPVDCLEEVNLEGNLPPVPDSQKDTRERVTEPKEASKNKNYKAKEIDEQTKAMKKQTYAPKGDYELATKNTKLDHSNEYNDAEPPKVKGMHKVKNINESQTLLEGLYVGILNEDVGTMSGGGGSQDGGDRSAGNPPIQSEDGEVEETFHVQDGETILTSKTALPQTGDYLPAGTPAWVYYMARQATPEQIKALMGNIHSSVPGGYGSYKDDSMLPRGLRGKTPGVEDEGAGVMHYADQQAKAAGKDTFTLGGKEFPVKEEVCPICGKDVCKCPKEEEAPVYESPLKGAKVPNKPFLPGGDPKNTTIKASKHSHHGS